MIDSLKKLQMEKREMVALLANRNDVTFFVKIIQDGSTRTLSPRNGLATKIG